MTHWHRIKHKTRGEVQHVADLAGVDPAEWDAVPIGGNRSPESWESVSDTGEIVADAAAATKLEDEGKLGRMTLRERHRLAIKTAKLELIDDLESEAVILPPTATRLRTRAER